MLLKLKAAWASLTAAGAEADAPAAPVVEYQGYRIQPAPYKAGSAYQLAGVIEKDFPDGPKQHRFVRADTHTSRDGAIEFAIAKAKQIIDLQGDRIFTE